jgi:hypothetical protein
MHDICILFLAVFLALGISNIFWGWMALTSFLEQYPRLDCAGDIDCFKQMVASQMYQSFAQNFFVVCPVCIFIGGVWTEHLVLNELSYLLIPLCLMAFFGVFIKGTKKQVQAVPALNAVLARQRDEVVKTWATKAFPDW